MTAATVKIGRKSVNLSNLDKVLYPDAHFTKSQVIDYYSRIAKWMLPHLRGRPLTLKRYPNGVDAHFFYEKMCPSHRPPWVDTIKVPSRREEGYVNYCLVQDQATLVWVANLASLEFHTLLARANDISKPTMMVFDLDPGPPANILDSARIALQMKNMFEHLNLRSFVKTSGGKGLHVYVPLNTPVTFDQTKSFANRLANVFALKDPQHVTAKMKRDLRPGKVFIDWSQNDEHKTTVCVYSLRARQRPTVSTPLQWSEVEQALKKDDPELLSFETEAVLDRVERLGDLFSDMNKVRQRLPAAD